MLHVSNPNLRPQQKLTERYSHPSRTQRLCKSNNSEPAASETYEGTSRNKLTHLFPHDQSNIEENYYYVFVGCCVVYLVIVYLYYPETKQRTLEEIAAAFGDKVVDVKDEEINTDALALDSKPKSDHVEGRA